ncbi:MAG: hypothetical protein HY804_07250 [Nitrospinae bacterium]|nr:hypothetical protein [Nitrospinota bacterium]
MTEKLFHWLANFLWARAAKCVNSVLRENRYNTNMVWSEKRIIIFQMLLLILIVPAFMSYFRFGGEYQYVTTFVMASILCWLWYVSLRKFWRVGLAVADVNIKSGLDYGKSLSLCKNSLCFLGLGASKLTDLPEFAEALKRCNRDDEVRIKFLIVRPNNQQLATAARKYKISEKMYEGKVEGSIKKLAEQKKRHGINLQVKYYSSEKSKDYPIFRMMFIDDQLCLLSYNVFGEGDGSQLPQLCINKGASDRDTDSFYYPMKLYFDKLWSDPSSEEIDYEKCSE